MPLTLTCDCGARFEVDDLSAGRPVPCPECKHELRAPGRPTSAPRLSQLAVLSPLLALVGAFTLVGTAAAALLGLYALVEVRRRPGGLTGAPFAVAGVALGAVLTLATLAGYLGAESLPLDGWLRAWALAGQLEPLATPEVSSSNGECQLTAPPGWMKVRGARTAHPVVGELQLGCDVLLFHPRRNAYLDITRLAPSAAPQADGLHGWLVEQFGKPRPPLVGGDDAAGAVDDRPAAPSIRQGEALPPVDGLEVDERLVDLRRGSVSWRFVVRSYGQPRPRGAVATAAAWVVRGYAPAHRFDSSEAELRAALDSVRFAP